jgi:hypothetical protein
MEQRGSREGSGSGGNLLLPPRTPVTSLAHNRKGEEEGLGALSSGRGGEVDGR